MSKWKLIRIALIVFVAVSSLFLPLEPQAKPPIDWNALAVIFIFIPFGLLFVVGLQAINPLSAKVWHKPDWNLNPFNFKDPVQFFHLGAFVMLAQGAVVIFRLPFANVPFYPESLIPLAMGVGTYIGVHLIMLIFRAKYSENA